MIPAKPGTVAVFKCRFSDPHAKDERRTESVGDQDIELAPNEYLTERDVVAWDDEGQPLIMGDRGLRSPHSNFVGVRESEHKTPIVALVPADGWLSWQNDKAGWWSVRLAAWGLKADGSCVPLAPDTDFGLYATDTENIRHESEGPPDPITPTPPTTEQAAS